MSEAFRDVLMYLSPPLVHFRLPPVRGSYSARVPRSSLAGLHREFVHHILEDEVDGQYERQDDKREDGEQREESGAVEESQNKHMRMTHDARTTNTRLEPRMCV